MRSRRGIVLAFALLTAPSGIAGVAVLWLMQSPVPTQVALRLAADRVRLVLGGSEAAAVVDAVGFASLQAGGFARVRLVPAALQRADPERAADAGPGPIPDAAWARIDPAPELEITAPRPDLQPAVTIEPEGEAATGRLQLVRAAPGTEVVLEASGGESLYLSIHLDGAGAVARVNPGPRFLLFADNCAVAGAGLSATGDAEAFRVARSPSDPLTGIEGGPRGLGLDLALAPAQAGAPVTRSQLPVTALDLERQGAGGERVTSLVADGDLRYPEYPSVKPRRIARTDFVSLGAAGEFRVLALSIDRIDGRAGLALEVAGPAASLRTGTPALAVDHRLSRFDTLRHSPTLVALFGIVVWIFGTTVGAWKLWKELGK